MRVLTSMELTWLPADRAILLQETFERATSWSTVQPDRHFIDWCAFFWLEDPE